jgi:hypothetical protein
MPGTNVFLARLSEDVDCRTFARRRALGSGINDDCLGRRQDKPSHDAKAGFVLG